MAKKPKLVLSQKLRQTLLADDGSAWHTLTITQLSEILDKMLVIMLQAASDNDSVTIQRLGSTIGVLTDRIRGLRDSGDSRPPITCHADAQARIDMIVARLTAFLDPSAAPAPQDVVSADADNPSIPAEGNKSA